MTLFRSFVALVLVAGLAACSTTTDDASATAGTGAGAGAGYGAGSLDPSSVEYFNTDIGDKVYFATDSSSLDAVAQQVLRRQAEWLIANNAGRSVVIEGHADERGTREYNLALGARRAAAARNFLVGEGVPADMLRTVTYGKERPVSLCSAPSCWQLNRRAVTVVAGGPMS